MSLLFLDFDGVVSVNDSTGTRSGPERLIRPAVLRLNSLVERTGADVVVSSTWRELGRAVLLPWLRGAGYEHGLAGVTMGSQGRDLTRVDIERHRGQEILAWRRLHASRAPYVVLDDLALRGPVARRLVRVEGGHLSDEDVERAVVMLGEAGQMAA